jgi:hypothetical protein
MVRPCIPFFLLLGLALSDKLTAQLFIIAYNPLYLNLTFSQPTDLPKFQLLFNEIPINYTVEATTSNDTGSYYFIIEGLSSDVVDPADYITEKYVLMFTEPLTIAAGNLNLDSFLLRAVKSQAKPTYLYQPLTTWDVEHKVHTSSNMLDGLAIAIISMTYFLSFTTFIGLRMFNFLGIYIFITLQS